MNIKNNYKFDFFIMVISFLLIIIGMYNGSTVKLIAFLLPVICLGVFSDDIAVCNLFFLLPFAPVLKVSPESTSLYTIIEILTVGILLVKKWRIERKFGSWLMLYFIYIFVGSVFATQIQFFEIIKQVIRLFLLYNIAQKNDNQFIDNVLWFFTVGTFLSSIVGLFGESIPGFSLYVRQIGVDSNIVSRFSGLNGDPNYYSINLIIILLINITRYRNKPFLYWPVFLGVTFFGVQTYSRSFILMWAVTVILCVCVFIRNRQWFEFIMIAAVALVGVLFFNKGEFQDLSLLLNRFVNFDVNAGVTNGRTHLWTAYLSDINGSLIYILFGHGFSASLLNGKGVHNFYIEVFYYLGIIGSFIYVLTIKCAVASKQKINRYRINYLPLVILLVMYAFLQMYFANEFVYQLLICLVLVNGYQHNKPQIYEVTNES